MLLGTEHLLGGRQNVFDPSGHGLMGDRDTMGCGRWGHQKSVLMTPLVAFAIQRRKLCRKSMTPDSCLRTKHAQNGALDNNLPLAFVWNAIATIVAEVATIVAVKGTRSGSPTQPTHSSGPPLLVARRVCCVASRPSRSCCCLVVVAACTCADRVVAADTDHATLRSFAFVATDRHAASSIRVQPSALQRNARPSDG